jgi:hypothetical protein
MNRMIHAACAAAILTSGLGSIGCVHTGGTRDDGHGPLGDCYRNAVDPCYPERYLHAARQATVYPFAQQVYNGHVLNQTIWNYYFEAGSDKLTPAGIEKLESIVRTRPGPDPRLYIQTARDIPATADPAKVPDVRADLDTRRAATLQRFLAAQPAFGPVPPYEIFVHDAPVPGINSEMAGNAYRSSIRGYRGAITGAAGIGALGTGGSTNLTVAPIPSTGAGNPPAQGFSPQP